MDEALQLVDSKTCKSDSMAVLKEFLEAGKITPVIDRTYPLSEVVEAIRYLERDTLEGKSSSSCEANLKEHPYSPSGGEHISGDHQPCPGEFCTLRHSLTFR
jgi:Zinc-binding dehydrogenase